VPRFYLNITDCKKTYQDSRGLELIDASAAVAFARIVANDLRPDVKDESCFVDVRDQHGNQVAKVFVVPRH
jgi:hypothetical protein